MMSDICENRPFSPIINSDEISLEWLTNTMFKVNDILLQEMRNPNSKLFQDLNYDVEEERNLRRDDWTP